VFRLYERIGTRLNDARDQVLRLTQEIAALRAQGSARMMQLAIKLQRLDDQ
jgi:hypothetical protein